jgi:hypothetical protein
MDELSPDQVDQLLADPDVIGSEAEHAYYWENGCLPGQGAGHDDNPVTPGEDHHRWLSGMGDQQLTEHLTEHPYDTAAVERVRAQRAEQWQAWQDQEEDVF